MFKDLIFLQLFEKKMGWKICAIEMLYFTECVSQFFASYTSVLCARTSYENGRAKRAVSSYFVELFLRRQTVSVGSNKYRQCILEWCRNRTIVTKVISELHSGDLNIRDASRSGRRLIQTTPRQFLCESIANCWRGYCRIKYFPDKRGKPFAPTWMHFPSEYLDTT